MLSNMISLFEDYLDFATPGVRGSGAGGHGSAGFLFVPE